MAMLGMGNIGDKEGEDGSLDRSYVLYCFIFAAVWFVILSIPMWFLLEEEPASEDVETVQEALQLSWKETVKSLRNFELMKFLLALMLFNDATSTLHAVYLVYAAQIGLPVTKLVLGAVMMRVVSAISSLMWLGVSALMDPRSCFIGCIFSTMIAIVLCAWMDNIVDFYLMVLFMTIASSGTFIFAKVLMGSLTPKDKASHTFGFMGMVNRVAGFIGPFAFTILSILYGPRSGFIGLLLMALAGLGVLTTVDFEEGYKLASMTMNEYEDMDQTEKARKEG